MIHSNGTKNNATWVLGSIFFVATILGVVTFFNYTRTEKSVQKGIAHLLEEGKSLSMQGCVKELLTWTSQCEGIKTVCDASAPILMESCLRAQDRSAECGENAQVRKDSKFGFKECSVFTLTKDRRKVCGNAFRAFDSYCRTRVVAGKL